MLPAPDLDDRRFQELVDEAKRRVQKECPEWTDHNVSDPGVMLIELFAWMTDQTVYRLNRVPERLYVKYLELLGLQLYPAAAARVPLTFWLSGVADDTVTVPLDHEVATTARELDDVVRFRTTVELQMPPSQVLHVATGQEGRRFDESAILQGGAPFNAFQAVPVTGDELLIGLDAAKPRCAVMLTFECSTEGVGVDPDDPPLRWEAWDGGGWLELDVDDDTGGLNRPGTVTVHLPESHATSSIEGLDAGWIRCRVLEPHDDQPAYTESPQVTEVHAKTVGGTVEAVNARIIQDEVVGLSEGVAGQSFSTLHRPILTSESPVEVEVAAGHGWEVWEQVSSFAEAAPTDKVFMLDAVSGTVRFGPAVRLPDGSLRTFGGVPPAGAPIRIRSYTSGGGTRGNVAKGTVTDRIQAIPFVDSVENRRPGLGGVDSESVENAKHRGPRLLHTRNRAVTASDYELLAREAAPDIARVACVRDDTEDGTGARVLVVPALGPGRIEFDDLLPPEETLQRIRDYLDERRTIGARISVETPRYKGLTVVTSVRGRRTANADDVQEACLSALYAYFHPVSGGPAGTGWPFGRPIVEGEVYSVLQNVEGVDYIQEARLFPADPSTGDREDPADRILLDPTWLVFSYEHRVRVQS